MSGISKTSCCRNFSKTCSFPSVHPIKKMNKQLLKMAEDGYRLGEREMQFLFNYRMNGEMKEEEGTSE